MIDHRAHDQREHGPKPSEGTLEYDQAEARALLAKSRAKHVFEREQAMFAEAEKRIRGES